MQETGRAAGEQQDAVAIVDDGRGHMDLFRLPLERDQRRRREHWLHPPEEPPPVLARQEDLLRLRRRIAELDAHQEAVELGLRQGKGPDLKGRVLGGDDEKGLQEHPGLRRRRRR